MIKTAQIKVRKTATGWRKRAPQRGSQRRELKVSCGAQAFLDAKKLAYPVMSTSTGKAACTFDCGGIQAAYKRARQQHSNKLAKKAHRLGKRLGCTWAARPFGPVK